jgi:hypothetical protein
VPAQAKTGLKGTAEQLGNRATFRLWQLSAGGGLDPSA